MKSALRKLFVVLALASLLLNLAPQKVVKAASGLDLTNYCRLKGWSYATLVSFNAYGWVCIGYDGSQHGMDLNQACNWQYGYTWSARFRSFSDPYSWECNHWCYVIPQAGVWSSHGPELRVRGPDPMNWDEGRSEFYYIYYQGNYSNNYPAGGPYYNFSEHYMYWGVDTTWAAQHALDWSNSSNWLIWYTRQDNSCPFTQS